MAESERAKKAPQMPQKERGGKITTSGRLSLPKSKFALPPSPEEKRRGIKGRYPIDTEERARNALARGSQNATPDELERIRRAVAREYPGIEQRATRGGKR